jgi:hypothetical protein
MTAKALGLTIPPKLFALAEKVIEYRLVRCTAYVAVWPGTDITALLNQRPLSGSLMDMQADNKSGFANDLWAQLAALVIVLVVLIALAAKYIW